MFGQGDNAFCCLAADACGDHMRITLNFWGNILNRRCALGSRSAHSNDRKNWDPSVKTQHPAVSSAVRKLRDPPMVKEGNVTFKSQEKTWNKNTFICKAQRILRNVINYEKNVASIASKASINQTILSRAVETTVIICIVWGKSIETPEVEPPNWDLVSVGTLNS